MNGVTIPADVAMRPQKPDLVIINRRSKEVILVEQNNQSQQFYEELQKAGGAGDILHLEREILLRLEWGRSLETTQ